MNKNKIIEKYNAYSQCFQSERTIGEAPDKAMDCVEFIPDMLEKIHQYEKAITKAIIYADEFYSDNVDADHAIRDMFEELRKSLKNL